MFANTYDGHIYSLSRYLQDEHKTKKSAPMDISDWRLESDQTKTPRQENGSDCGVFACAFAYLISENLPLNINQQDIDEFRSRMGSSILDCEIVE